MENEKEDSSQVVFKLFKVYWKRELLAAVHSQRDDCACSCLSALDKAANRCRYPFTAVTDLLVKYVLPH